jgi:hypothetical protein
MASGDRSHVMICRHKDRTRVHRRDANQLIWRSARKRSVAKRYDMPAFLENPSNSIWDTFIQQQVKDQMIRFRQQGQSCRRV